MCIYAQSRVILNTLTRGAPKCPSRETDNETGSYEGTQWKQKGIATNKACDDDVSYPLTQ